MEAGARFLHAPELKERAAVRPMQHRREHERALEPLDPADGPGRELERVLRFAGEHVAFGSPSLGEQDLGGIARTLVLLARFRE